MTIEQIQSAIDAKYDARQIINMIADYIQANPSADGLPSSLSEDAEIDLNGHSFQLRNGGIDQDVLRVTETEIFLNAKLISTALLSKDFADDSAAETGGIEVGELYHTSGTLKIRLV